MALMLFIATGRQPPGVTARQPCRERSAGSWLQHDLT